MSVIKTRTCFPVEREGREETSVQDGRQPNAVGGMRCWAEFQRDVLPKNSLVIRLEQDTWKPITSIISVCSPKAQILEHFKSKASYLTIWKGNSSVLKDYATNN